MSRISKADRQLQLQREEAGDHLFANRVQGLSEVGARTGAPVQMGGADRLSRHLLSAALAALASRRQPAGPGGAALDLARALLLLQSRVLAAGHLLPDRPADHGRGHAVPGHQPARPRLVRLHLSADGVDRSVHVDRAPDRRRPQRTHEARRGTADASTPPGARRRSTPSGSASRSGPAARGSCTTSMRRP